MLVLLIVYLYTHKVISSRRNQFGIEDALGVKPRAVDVFSQRRPPDVTSVPAAAARGMGSAATICILVFAFVAVAAIAALITVFVIQGKQNFISHCKSNNRGPD